MSYTPYYVSIEGESEEGQHEDQTNTNAGNLAIIAVGPYNNNNNTGSSTDDNYYYRGLYDNVRTPLVLWGMCNAIPLCTASLLAWFWGLSGFVYAAAWAPFVIGCAELLVIVANWMNMSRAIQIVVSSWIELPYFVTMIILVDDVLLRIFFGAWTAVFHVCLHLTMYTKMKW